MTVRGRMKEWIVSTLGAWPDCHLLRMAVACCLWWALRRLLRAS
jgi:hypothetical protein